MIEAIEIIRNIVCGYDEEISQSINWDEIWKFAVSNQLTRVFFEAIQNCKNVEPNMLIRIEQDYYRQLALSIRQDECRKKIKEILDNNNLHYAFQKGSVLQNDYPEKEMRSMADIDVYINPENRKSIRKLLEESSFVFRGTESGDEQYLYMNTVGVEFHGRLLYRKVKGRIENYPAWEFVDLQNNKLTEEGFALNLIGHAVSDMAKGGPKIRHILDLWIYRNKHKPQPNWDVVNKKLKDDNIYIAARNLIDLSEFLFGEKEPTDLLIEMRDYLLNGKTYGEAGSALEIARAGGKGRALLRQIFRNRTEFENRYSWVKKYPFLLPVAYIKRLLESFRKNKDAIRTWKEDISKVDKEYVREQELRIKRWGL